jgi:hypothetical protein
MRPKGSLGYTTFNLPTELAANLLLFGPSFINSNSAMASSTKIVKEGAAKGEAIAWIKLAYSLARHKGRELFAAASGGGTDLLAATPTMILLTPNKAFIVVSFKPGAQDAQLLCALELSRTFQEYTNFHVIHSANIITKDDRAVFNASMTVVSVALKSYLSSLIEGHEATHDIPDLNGFDVDPEPVEVESGEPVGEPGPAEGEPAGEPVIDPVGV